MTSRKLIDRNIFFDNPEIGGGQLSPDGKLIAFMKAYNGIMNIYVKNIDADFKDSKILTKSKSPIMGYFWTRDSKYILFVNDNDGDENINIFSIYIDSESHETTNLTPLEEVSVRIYKVSRLDPDVLWIGINDRDKAWHDLYKLTISTQNLELLYTNKERITGWELDWDENIRIAYRSDITGFEEILSVKNLKDFIVIYKTNLKENAGVAGWNAENTMIYLESNKGDVDLSTLYEMDPESLSITIVESDPEGKVDFGNLLIHRHTREILATFYMEYKYRRYWKNEEWKTMYESLQDRFPGREVTINSTTDDYSTMLIRVGGDMYASSVWSYDWTTGKFLHQYTSRPK